MKILVLAPQPFFVHRGTPIAMRMLIETLTSVGHRVHAVTYAEGEDVDLPGATFARVPRLPGTSNMPPGFSIKKVICDVVMFPMVAWMLLRGRFDMIIANEESAFIAMLLRPIFRVPYVYDMDSSIPEQMNDKYGLPNWLFHCLSRAEGAVARRSIGAITCCRALEKLVNSYAPTIPVQTLEDVTLLDGIDETTLPEDCAFEEPVVMYVGNLETYQGVDLLVEGFTAALHQGVHGHLVIIGGSAEHVALLEAKVSDMGFADKISVLGPRPIEQLGAYLCRASIVVSPRTQGHNTPMKIYSYLDSGRPLLATRIGSHTQVLDDDIAMLVEPTPEAVGQGLAQLLGDQGLRDRLARAAKQRVKEQFSRDAYKRKLLGFVDDKLLPRLTNPISTTKPAT